MSVLKGITWDHPRGYEPLHAVASLWKEHSGIETIWDIRSLKDFGDCPIENLISIYDLIILDHPYMGEVASKHLLITLDTYLNNDFVKSQRQQSLGPSFDSYWYKGHLWALPVDAAAQVAAYRKDLVAKIADWSIPLDIAELRDTAKILPSKSIGVPLCPTDIWCVFLTLCAQYSNGDFFSNGGIKKECGEWALEQIISWKEFIYAGSFKMNPIQMLELMSEEDSIIYVPYTFGYTNYARIDYEKRLIHFTNAPRYNKSKFSSLLGGTGIAVSVKTQQLEECVKFIEFLLSNETQAGTYYANGGQPAHLQAWLNNDNNNDCSDFFSNTIETLQSAYVRPRHEGFNRFQEKAGDLIHTSVLTGQNISLTIRKLNEQYKRIRDKNI